MFSQLKCHSQDFCVILNIKCIKKFVQLCYFDTFFKNYVFSLSTPNPNSAKSPLAGSSGQICAIFRVKASAVFALGEHFGASKPSRSDSFITCTSSGMSKSFALAHFHKPKSTGEFWRTIQRKNMCNFLHAPSAFCETHFTFGKIEISAETRLKEFFS